MVAFASPEWIEQFDAVVRRVDAAGPPLRVRYEFLADPAASAADAVVGRYDLIFGDGIRAEAPTGAAEPPPVTVTISQPWVLAREVAAGRVAAQQALLDGSIRIDGRVAELLAWRDALDAIDAAAADLRARTTWPQPA